MKTNAQKQADYKQRMRDAELERVELWRPKGTGKEFKAEHCMSKTVPDLRKKAPV